MRRIIGIDPGLRFCGLGIIDTDGNALRFVHSATIKPRPSLSLQERLLVLNEECLKVIEAFKPQEAALEETFVSVNGQSTLKLGQARGAILLTLAQAGLPVHEYAAKLVKKSLTGAGGADKAQMGYMVKMLLPQSDAQTEDEADALAIAITHLHHSQNQLLATDYH